MEKNPTILTVVAAALVRDNGDILVQSRPEGKAMAGLWEFPGGKVEKGELQEEALCRELFEELGIQAATKDMEPATFVTWPMGACYLVLSLYICRSWSGEPSSQEGANIKWVLPYELEKLDMPPADYPLVKRLTKLL